MREPTPDDWKRLSPGVLPPTSRWPDGTFTGQPTPDRSKGSLKARAREVLGELTTTEQGEMSQAERIVRAVVERAATGHVEATKLLADLTEEKQESGNWEVTIQYVHQQVTVQPSPGLSLPPPDPSVTTE